MAPCSVNTPSSFSPSTDAVPIGALPFRHPKILRPCFDKEIICAKCESRPSFSEKMNQFLIQNRNVLRFWSDPNYYAIATQEHVPLNFLLL
jgi:hypothetical protein